jgi:hypothetical protein
LQLSSILWLFHVQSVSPQNNKNKANILKYFKTRDEGKLSVYGCEICNNTIKTKLCYYHKVTLILHFCRWRASRSSLSSKVICLYSLKSKYVIIYFDEYIYIYISFQFYMRSWIIAKLKVSAAMWAFHNWRGNALFGQQFPQSFMKTSFNASETNICGRGVRWENKPFVQDILCWSSHTLKRRQHVWF